MDFCGKVDEMSLENLQFVASGQDGRSSKARELRRKHSQVWASATDDDLKMLARRDSERFDFLPSYSKLLSRTRKTRTMHRKRLRDPHYW